jgi:hypothetical protein
MLIHASNFALEQLDERPPSQPAQRTNPSKKTEKLILKPKGKKAEQPLKEKMKLSANPVACD